MKLTINHKPLAEVMWEEQLQETRVQSWAGDLGTASCSENPRDQMPLSTVEDALGTWASAPSPPGHPPPTPLWTPNPTQKFPTQGKKRLIQSP